MAVMPLATVRRRCREYKEGQWQHVGEKVARHHLLSAAGEEKEKLGHVLPLVACRQRLAREEREGESLTPLPLVFGVHWVARQRRSTAAPF